MSPKCKKYKDVYAAPASDLYKALENKDNKTVFKQGYFQSYENQNK